MISAPVSGSQDAAAVGTQLGEAERGQQEQASLAQPQAPQRDKPASDPAKESGSTGGSRRQESLTDEPHEPNTAGAKFVSMRGNAVLDLQRHCQTLPSTLQIDCLRLAADGVAYTMSVRLQLLRTLPHSSLHCLHEHALLKLWLAMPSVRCCYWCYMSVTFCPGGRVVRHAEALASADTSTSYGQAGACHRWQAAQATNRAV